MMCVYVDMKKDVSRATLVYSLGRRERKDRWWLRGRRTRDLGRRVSRAVCLNLPSPPTSASARGPALPPGGCPRGVGMSATDLGQHSTWPPLARRGRALWTPLSGMCGCRRGTGPCPNRTSHRDGPAPGDTLSPAPAPGPRAFRLPVRQPSACILCLPCHFHWSSGPTIHLGLTALGTRAAVRASRDKAVVGSVHTVLSLEGRCGHLRVGTCVCACVHACAEHSHPPTAAHRPPHQLPSSDLMFSERVVSQTGFQGKKNRIFYGQSIGVDCFPFHPPFCLSRNYDSNAFRKERAGSWLMGPAPGTWGQTGLVRWQEVGAGSQGAGCVERQEREAVNAAFRAQPPPVVGGSPGPERECGECRPSGRKEVSLMVSQ